MPGPNASPTTYAAPAYTPEREQLISSLRQFIRTRGPDYLQDPNISSVGVGYRTNGTPEAQEIALQFTVDKKVGPEDLEALGTTAVPESVTVDGVEVPTQVIERTFAPDFRVVAETESPVRKQRLDPVVPGASVGNTRQATGTIGLLVFDRADGTPYVLSNWHVLHGPGGVLGQPTVQPGTRDDNRVAQNLLGPLVRSHLGMAGDCAVAAVKDRRFDPTILELGVAPTALGDPQLGDKVIKSGRTTGVTHGVVRRVDTMAKIQYEGAGEQLIGCFEIAVDPEHLPADGEVSSGGDSGSAWMFTGPDGNATTVVAGLHFGGETAGNPDEHALACLPASVFEKLGISLERPSAEALEAVGGYNPDFLGVELRIATPELHEKIKHDAFRLNGSEVIPYTHFSLAQSESRRFALWVAWNVDGGSLKNLARSGIEFRTDPRLPGDVQVGNELYRNNRLDRGHIARRADLLWGSADEAGRANADSFFYTNITPQMDDFNQSARTGVWGRLEDALFAEVDVDDLRISVFGGPVYQDDDRVYRGIRIPREFWKVIAFADQGVLRAKAFLLTQNLDQLEALDLDEFRVFQINLGELEERTHLRFPVALRKADTLAAPEAMADRRPLDTPADIQWR
ncbi:DNA/RNA non-specific endonuclease [Kitasatospora herbaricolor]|uniref:DNA/RNA non-specific endonuclease n=2 Tax=Kitasatospora herbaricolor TaxID=68217 RepID=A0ABZ1WHV9_9ACTN|nr:DNA/RNA non-specific endonuclease [Kitasatospora herbaricolor]